MTAVQLTVRAEAEADADQVQSWIARAAAEGRPIYTNVDGVPVTITPLAVGQTAASTANADELELTRIERDELGLELEKIKQRFEALIADRARLIANQRDANTDSGELAAEVDKLNDQLTEVTDQRDAARGQLKQIYELAQELLSARYDG